MTQQNTYQEENMELAEMLNYILYTVLTLILPVVAKYIIDFLKAKISASDIIADITQNEHMDILIKNALTDVMDAVLFVNQTYTDSLKASGQFDETAHKEAFNRAYVEALNLISDEAKKAIESFYGSFDKWLQLKIESSVNIAKK